MAKVSRSLAFMSAALAVGLAATVAMAASLRPGASGPDVKKLQEALTALNFYTGTIDSKYGAKTKAAVVKFQTAKSLKADGIVGDGTRKLLYPDAVTESRKLRNGDSGNDVEELQQLLKNKGEAISKVDGKFGAKTEAALKSFQKKNGMTQDGVAGTNTWAKLRS